MPGPTPDERFESSAQASEINGLYGINSDGANPSAQLSRPVTSAGYRTQDGGLLREQVGKAHADQSRCIVAGLSCEAARCGYQRSHSFPCPGVLRCEAALCRRLVSTGIPPHHRSARVRPIADCSALAAAQ